MKSEKNKQNIKLATDYFFSPEPIVWNVMNVSAVTAKTVPTLPYPDLPEPAALPSTLLSAAKKFAEEVFILFPITYPLMLQVLENLLPLYLPVWKT